jgi:hypothetical protein
MLGSQSVEVELHAGSARPQAATKRTRRISLSRRGAGQARAAPLIVTIRACPRARNRHHS